MQNLAIIVPVFNEGAAFPAFWQVLCSNLRVPFHAIAVYDFDEDNTIPVAERIIAAGEGRLTLARNHYGRGVMGAIRTGFDSVASGPILVAMADLSDDLAKVEQMLEMYRQGYQVVVGSRYMQGGAVLGGPWLKQMLSRAAGTTLHWLRGVPTHDATNAFKIYDATMLKNLLLESRRGFELSLEITVKAFLAGYRITEIPAVWRHRTIGKSHFRLWKWLPSYIRWYLYAFRPRNLLCSPTLRA
jgi:cellulose synthase/poly-beta-1,6-N-acetylglucosamine synthase-like glycosyltransferase